MYSVCLDAGHGEHDPGAIGPTGLREKDINLIVTLRVGQKLKNNGIKVVYTRTNDTPGFPKDLRQNLARRVSIANMAKVDCFVSIHCNSVANRIAHGTETYCVKLGHNAERLSKAIQSEIIKVTGFTNRGVKTANYYVLKYTLMPAALTEVAFISNPGEEKLLKDPNFQETAATAIARGICKYFGIEYKEFPTVNVISGDKEYTGYLIDSKTYVHARVIEEHGIPVHWDGETKTVFIGTAKPIFPKHEHHNDYDVITAKPENLTIGMVKGSFNQDGINGGYFDGSLNPLGIVVINGKIIANRVAHRPPRAVFVLDDNKADIQKVDNANGIKAKYALGAGPLLLPNVGQDEGFQNDVINSVRERSAVGVTKEGLVKLVATKPMSLNQLSNLMKSIGCVKAMNLDGGGSSHLRWSGKTVRGGGRTISTAIIIA